MRHIQRICLFSLSIWFLLGNVGCKSAYLSSQFNTRTADHQVVAILPFDMVFTGLKPESLSDEDMERIADAESRAFMISFYNAILGSTHGGRDALRVDVLHYDQVLARLNRHGLDAQTAWQTDPGTLIDILAVDAVVKARIEKRRLLSDLDSYGIDLGIQIMNVLSNYRVAPWLPYNATKAKEVRCTYDLLHGDGTVLWSIAYDVDADWRQRSNDIIDRINRRAAKRFPYRD